MDCLCYHCGAVVEAVDGRVSIRAECTGCRRDLHVCRNCRYYDRGSYNDCREPQAERVVDKESANRCDYFEFVKGRGQVQADQTAVQKKKLDDLFK